MNEQIKQIADRLKGLRESLDLNIQDIASVCGISADEYASFESGEKDIPVSVLHNISKKYGEKSLKYINIEVFLYSQPRKMILSCLNLFNE